MKKKYLQACEIGGSLYGKKRTTRKKNTRSGKNPRGKNLLSAYDTFYRNQLNVLDGLIRRDR